MQKMNNRKQNNHSGITDRECEEIGFSDYCLMIAENPKENIDDIEALNAIADFKNPNEDEKALRLSAAIRLLRLQPKNPINDVIMAALKDRKSINGDLLAIVGLEYDY